MQGRLSPLVGGRIQAFPWPSWIQEFAIAESKGFRLMEWTLDQERLHENPLMTAEGQAVIVALCRRHGLSIPSLTGDCFMQAPFWKRVGAERATLQRDFCAVVRACSAVGITIMVMPLVDGGRLDDARQEKDVVAFLQEQTGFLVEAGLRVAFESDFSPPELARFIGRLDPEVFGINYDIGNSAALGFDPNEEFEAYGRRVINVHVKDRVRGGSTVPLGEGDADFERVFSALGKAGYAGNYILQTARAGDGEHAQVLCRYRDMTMNFLSHHAA